MIFTLKKTMKLNGLYLANIEETKYRLIFIYGHELI